LKGVHNNDRCGNQADETHATGEAGAPARLQRGNDFRGWNNGFTIEGLARQANVSVPLVYNYFTSRTELLQDLLIRDFTRFNERTHDEIERASTFEEIVRAAVKSNFEHYAPGTVLPILMRQAEIVSVIRDKLALNARQASAYLVEQTTAHYKLDHDTARLLVELSSGAAWSAAELAGRQNRNIEEVAELTVSYILAGIEALSKRKHSQ
jgi:AcrR family transcriptional regulator